MKGFFNQNRKAALNFIVVMTLATGFSFAGDSVGYSDVSNNANRVQSVDGEELKRLVETSDVPIIIDFYASWAGPSVRMEPLVEKVATKYRDRARVVRIDLSNSKNHNADIASKFNIGAIPTLLIIKNKTLFYRRMGYKGDDEAVISWLDEILK